LLDAAVDHGFTHFDTAPLYGFGMAERDLAPILARHPHVTVTTKVGLYSPGGERQPRASVMGRKALGRFVAPLARPTSDWGVARARRMLEASLRRLGRERIDLYLLHEPHFASLDEQAWLGWLEDEQARGRVGQFGIAVDTGALGPFLAADSPLLRFVQTVDSLEGREAEQAAAQGVPVQITYGYVSDALRRHGVVDVPSVLEGALRRRRGGAVIVSTRKVGRLRQFAEIAAREAA
jgi:aryl-alcohol dehydrogenase-like predicted oxidoreductase